jgi:hypothetical protein
MWVISYSIVLKENAVSRRAQLAWMACFRRLACEYERLPHKLVGLHLLAFVMLVLHRFIHLMDYDYCLQVITRARMYLLSDHQSISSLQVCQHS